MSKPKFSLSTNRKEIKKDISLDDVLDNPGKDLVEIKEEKRKSVEYPWEESGVSKKERDSDSSRSSAAFPSPGRRPRARQPRSS